MGKKKIGNNIHDAHGRELLIGNNYLDIKLAIEGFNSDPYDKNL
jgi:hypothetical protein